MKTISAADANRHFSRVLREVSQGEHVTVVSRGRPVATIAPARGSGRERQAAKRMLLERLRRQPAVGARRWTRDEEDLQHGFTWRGVTIVNPFLPDELPLTCPPYTAPR